MGGVNAALITLLRIPPLIATIATLYLFASAALVLTNGIDINGFDRSPASRSSVSSKIAGFPTQVILVLLPAYVIAAIVLSRTPTGRRIYETGNNAQAALLTGVNVRATRAGLYITSGALAGLAARRQRLVAAERESGRRGRRHGAAVDHHRGSRRHRHHRRYRAGCREHCWASCSS